MNHNQGKRNKDVEKRKVSLELVTHHEGPIESLFSLGYNIHYDNKYRFQCKHGIPPGGATQRVAFMLACVEKSKTLPKFHLVACGSIKMIFSPHVTN